MGGSMKKTGKHPWGMKNAEAKMPKYGASAKKTTGKKPAMKYSKSSKK